MTDALQKEAREAADDWMETLPESGDLGNTETHVDDAYEAGYLAAAEPREKEIASLRARLLIASHLPQPSDLSGIQHDHGCASFRINEASGYFDGQPCDCGALSRWIDLAAKELRELRERVAELGGMVPGGGEVDDCDAKNRGFICTRRKGHTGNHVAHGAGGREVSSW